MIPPRILLQGNFAPQDIDVHWNPISNRLIDKEIEKHVEEEWQKILKGATEKGIHVYNGNTSRLNDFKLQKGKLTLEIAPMEFRVRESLVRIAGYYSLEESYFRKGIFCFANVETSDGHYIFVELSGKSLNTAHYEMLGGILEIEDTTKNQIDIFECLYREMFEEGGIERKYIQQAFLRSIILERETNIALYFEVKLSISAKEAIEIFDNSQIDPEISHLFCVPREKLHEQLMSMNENKQLIAQSFF